MVTMRTFGVVLLTAGLASAFNPFHRRQAVASDVAVQTDVASAASSTAAAQVSSSSDDSSVDGLNINDLLSNSSGSFGSGSDLGSGLGSGSSSNELSGIFSCADIDPDSIDVLSSLGNVADLLGVSEFVDVDALDQLAAEQQLMMLMLMEQLLQLEDLDFINSEEIVSLMQESLLVPSFTTIDFGEFSCASQSQ